MAFEFREDQIARIEKQSLLSLEKGFRQMVDMEVELESKLDIIRELKVRIMLEIEIKINMKK